LRRFNLILLAVAVGFFFWILNELGWANLWGHLRQVDGYWPVLLLPYGLVNLLEAISWRFILVKLPEKTSLTRLFWLRLGGEALNQLTPTASLGGEPFKAARLRADGVPLDQATASVVIHKGILVLSLVLYIILGLALAPLYLPVALAHLQYLSLGALGLAAAGGTGAPFPARGCAFWTAGAGYPSFYKAKKAFSPTSIPASPPSTGNIPAGPPWPLSFSS
jgi:glycosyltransferase 2 family protein